MNRKFTWKSVSMTYKLIKVRSILLLKKYKLKQQHIITKVQQLSCTLLIKAKKKMGAPQRV